MTDDKVNASSKTTTTNNNNPSLPATKSKLYGAARPATFRTPPHRNYNRDRTLCCTLCIYLSLLLFFLVVLLGVAATLFYLLFHPQPPSFTLTSLNISSSSSSSSSSSVNFDLTFSATNPNSKIVFSYQPASVSILTGAGDTSVGQGTAPAFEQAERNTTVLMASIESSVTELRNDAVTEVKTGEEKGVLAVKVKMVTKVEAKMGAVRMPHVGITVLCDGASVVVPSAAGKKVGAPKAVETVDSECEVDYLRFKVWKWDV